MTPTTTFEAIILLLLIDPESNQVDVLVEQLVLQTSQQDPVATEALLLRCVRWDDPSVYTMFDARLLEQGFELTAKPADRTGFTVLGIRRIAGNTVPDVAEAEPQTFNAGQVESQPGFPDSR